MIYIPKEVPLKYIVPYIYVALNQKAEVSTQEILHSMKYENTQYNRRWLNGSITYMIENGILDGRLIKQNTYEFNKQRFKLKPNKYYECEFSIIQDILNIEEKVNKVDLAGYYIFLISTINYKTKVGNCFISLLCNMSSLNKTTVVKYNKILERHKFIYIIHSTTKGKPNYYGLYDDFDYVVKEAYKAGVFIPQDIFNTFIKYKQLY